ncbi:MAG: GntR family transcriptional regulator, partial [Bacteroidota bacterium]
SACTYKLSFMPVSSLPKYLQLYHQLKALIQQDQLHAGDYLPSEHQLCEAHQVTRTTVRRALDELIRDGFIVKERGRGSRVRERRKSLNLLNVKGFSEAAGADVQTHYLRAIEAGPWPLNWRLDKGGGPCLHFERIRSVEEQPVMLEHNWFPDILDPQPDHETFVEGSFFKTLSSRYLIEITGSEQSLQAVVADDRLQELLAIPAGTPLIHIHAIFHSSRSDLKIYSELYCFTDSYPIGNTYLRP